MKVVIAGSRNLNDYALIEKAIADSGFQITEVVSGCARGVDLLGERWAKQHGIPVAKFPANWNAYGLRAGPIRNAEMADYADALIAIWDGHSKGTHNMINVALVASLPVHVYRVPALSSSHPPRPV